MCINKILRSKPRFSYWFACHLGGYCPTSKEIENDDVKNLAKRLEGVTEKETIDNILEWQEANILFWDERHPIPTVLFYSLGIALPVFLIAGFYLSLFLLLTSGVFPFSTILLIWISALVSSIITTLVIIAVAIRSNRKIPLIEGLTNAFKLSISLKMLLRRDRKLGICRDYAKLTACILRSIYKNSEIYFLHSSAHVATGIRIGQEVYMLDQRLPVLTINQWYKREHGSTPPSKLLFVYRKAHKLNGNRLESIPVDSLLSKTNISKIKSPHDLSFELSKLLNIPDNDSFDSGFDVLQTIELPKWAKGANLYEMNDSVVNYSLTRFLKRRIMNQILELSQITKIEIDKEAEDLVFRAKIVLEQINKLG
jgi:predicted transglutaminase-like protease